MDKKLLKTALIYMEIMLLLNIRIAIIIQTNIEVITIILKQQMMIRRSYYKNK